MNRLYILLFLSIGFVLNAQLKGVKKLKQIEKKYDSLLVSYQKNAKDSLSYLKKNERNEIMATAEAKIIERKKAEEYAQLERIKEEELEIDIKNLNIPEKYAKCNIGTDFQMPNLLVKTKYKPTLSKKTKQNLEGSDKGQLNSTVHFIVTADGYVKKVSAVGINADFNKELELTLYKIEKLTPSCQGGIAKTARYRMPVILNNL
jgi:hypothetical protein